MSLLDSIRRSIQEEQPFVLVTLIAGPNHVGRKLLVRDDSSVEGDLGEGSLSSRVVPAALECLQTERNETRTYDLNDGSFEAFFDCYVPPPRLVIIGAVQTAQVLTRLAKVLGYRVIVTDARAAFATPERFPEADEVLKGWPQDILPGIRMDDSTYLVLLSHDSKFDEPTLHFVLPLPVRYIGAIGARRTQQQRREHLIQQGFAPEAVARIHGPIGLDLGGRAPEETALSILAEMTAVRYGKPGGKMRDRA